MKNLLLGVLFTSVTLAAAPEAGLYKCIKGNEESICDQILKPYFVGGKLSAISVEYVGWCGSMGPYTYYCQDTICEDAGLKFEFKDSTHYFWENKQYDIHCDFQKK